MLDEWNSYLVSFDTDHIKEYLFATNRLKEIRGASALLAWLDERRLDFLKREFGDENVVYSAGGGATVLVENDRRTQQLIADMERKFRRQTHSGSITGIYLEPSQPNVGAVDDSDKKKFGVRMKLAAAQMAGRKSAKAELTAIPVQPYFRLCASCGQYPAQWRARDISGDLLCSSCYRKRKWGYRMRRGFYHEFLKHVQDKHGETFWKQAFMPDDLGDIGETATPNGYVGYLTIDGNKMGSTFRDLTEREQYRKLSDALAGLVQEITFEALRKYAKPRAGVSPFEIVLIGGDDIKLFTAADIAVSVARYIMREFENRSEELLKGIEQKETEPKEIEQKKFTKFTMAAGVVLCHSNFPIPALVDIGEELLKSAKQLCAKHEYAESAIDFEVITSSAADLDIARAHVPHNKPYTLSQIDKLLYYAQQLRDKQIPHTQLQMVYDACHHSKVTGTKVEGTMALLHTLGRLRKLDQRMVLKDFLIKVAGVDASKATHWPWIMVHKEKEQPETPQILKTALVDLIDLYEFTGKGDYA